MLKRTYKILKYINKHQEISQKDILDKFPDFEMYNCNPYLYKHDKSIEQYQQAKDDFLSATEMQNISFYEQSKRLNETFPQYIPDNSLIFYSTNLEFQEYIEEKQRKFWSFVLPYGITTAIAIASIVAQICG